MLSSQWHQVSFGIFLIYPLPSLTVFSPLATLVAKDVDGIVERAREFIGEANQVVKAHAELSSTHIHFLVRYGVEKVSKSVTEIVALQKKLDKRTGELNSLEVSLLRLVIGEEANLYFAEKVFLHYATTRKDETEIILYGVQLMKEGQELLDGGKLTDLQSHRLKENMANVKRLVDSLRANSNKRYPYAELPLIDYEKSLRSAIDQYKH